MTDTLPTLPPYDENGYLTAEPAIAFTIKRVVRARRSKIFRAWTDPEMFKRWIVQPNQELVSFSFEAEGRAIWKTKNLTNNEDDEYVLDNQTLFPYKCIEARCFNPAVPGMLDEHPVNLLLTLKKLRFGDGSISTVYKLSLNYDNATLWRHTSHVDLHTFWLKATERLMQLVERDNIPSQLKA